MDRRRLKTILDKVETHLQARTKTVDGTVHPFYAFRPHKEQRGQIPFMSSEATIQVLWGGNRSGKSMCGDQKLRIAQLAFDPLNPTKKFKAPIRIWYCCRPADVRKAFKDYVDGIPPERIQSVYWGHGSEEVWTDNGSSLRMKSYGQDRTEYQREAVDIVRWDEEGEEDIWTECFTRLVSTNGKFILTFTPLGGTTWLDQKIRGLSPEYENLQEGPFAHFRVNPRDNPTISPEMIRAWEVEIGENETERRIRIDGAYVLMPGTKVFEETCRALYKQQRNPEYDVRFGAYDEAVRSTWNKDRSRGWAVWELPIPFASYVIGADVAKGVGGDFSVAHVICADTGLVVASFGSKEIKPWDFGCELRMMATYYNRALIAPEINSEGAAVLEAIRQYGYGRIYKRKSFGGRVKQIGNDEGWLTARNNKETAILYLNECLKKGLQASAGGVILYDEKTIKELSNFGYLNESRPGSHGMGGIIGHDDRVMSLAIAVQALEQAPKTQRRVGAGSVSRGYLDDWKKELLRNSRGIAEED